MLIGKPYSGLVIIELLSLGVTAEALRANIDWKSAFFEEDGSVWRKIAGRRDVFHQSFFVSQN